jgi:SHS2 domain-containing protein
MRGMVKFRLVKGPTSDVKFEAYGATAAELFENAALALSSVMCAVRNVKPKDSVEVFVEGKDMQDLLFNWLGEVIALVDIHSMFFSAFKVRIQGNKLKATCFGEEAKPKNSLTVVKSVTYHEFRLEGDDKSGWKAAVVLDI